MTGSPYGGEYPDRPDPLAPVDYPADAGLPPPVEPAAGYQPPGYPPSYPGYYPTPGYAYDPYRPVRPLGTNGKAIASLVSSLVGVFCCGVTCIVGVILGVIAMRETKQTGQDGYGIALAGTIIGGLAVAGFLIYLLLSIGLVASGLQWT
ncbi:DUF4190 domain-containing protein [Mycobacterium sp. E740]|uniref:DUF4190 domain-containing protein n=1 Tax=Mycobacterium sp. E740 TaxID=1834149 RepID=UPI0007FD3EFA|nr:DUF4190 domain-containing protein [Mycobacterium sp. E740]OBI80172.1 hypothetical protein A5663_01700 [Mycobacterium sp. E740]